MKTYKPLPSSVTIEPSEIHGLGVVAIQDILPNTSLGITHYFTGFEVIRTPLGGFGNHSDDPNCRKWLLITNRYIHQGEEITWKYDFYNPIKQAVT